MRASLHKQRHAIWQKKINISFLLPIFILLTSVITVFVAVAPAQAATSDNLNFQGRLATNTGGRVPDGSYNIEFKLYDAAVAGTNLWTETRTGGNQVTVRGGYFSVYLGDVTPFGASIPWDQDLWLGMNVNSDGEMTPRFKLTAVPYAFRAGALVDASGNAKTADDLIQKAPASVQAVNSALAAIRLNQTGAGSLLQLQGDGTNVFTVSKIGETVIGRGLTLGTSTSTTAGTIRWTGSDFEGFDGSTWKTLTSSGVASASDYISVTTNANSTASAAEYDVFQSGSYGAYSSTTNAIDGFVYTPADGRFTAASDGTYSINANLNLETTTNGLTNILVKVNGVNVYNNDIYIHTAVDPVERSVSLVRTLTAGDYVEVFVDAQAGNVTTHGGTTLNIVPVSTAGSGGVGGPTNAFEQSGNSFGSTAVIGTNDANGFRIITNTAAALEFASTGEATFYNGVDVDGLLSVNNGLEITSGNLDLGGGNITNAGSISASSISGNGSGLTNLDGDAIASGTIGDARLSANISRLDTANEFTDVQTFTGGSVLGNFLSSTAGAVRWNGTDFEGFDGTQWVSFTSSGTLATPAAATFYDSTGGATIASGVFSTINLDATLENSDVSVISLSGDEVTITEDGYYEVSYQVTASLNSGTRSGFNAKLQRDAGIGFIDVPGSQAYHYGRTIGETAGTSAASIVLNLSAGDVIRIQGSGTSQSFSTSANGTSLTVVRVTNGSGGGGGGGGLSFVQNGNAFSTTAILGTTDNNGLRFVTNNLNALEFTSSGVATFSQQIQAANGIDITSGGLDLSGGNIVGVNSITATTFNGSFAGDGSAITGLTNLDGDEITTGTISSARLDSDVALLNANQTFTGIPTFGSGLILGDSVSTTAGTIKWSGTDFEGFNGVSWVSLTGSPAPPSGGPSSIGPFTFDADNDADEDAFTFVSDNGTNGLNAANTARAWSHDTDDTASADVGPTSGQGGNPDGYIYTEASAPAAFGDTFTVTLDEVLDASAADWTVDFYWNQRGNDNLATVQVQTNEAGAGWVTRGTYATGGPDVATGGAQQWNQESLDLAGTVSDASTQVRFLVTLGATGTVWNNDFALDTITFISSEDSGGSSEPVFAQGGNAFGAAGVLGTTDNQGLSIITNNTAAIIVSAGGESTFINNTNFNGKIALGTSPTVDSDAQAQFYTGSATGKGLVIQGATSQSENLFELQDNTGVVLGGFSSNGGLVLGLSTVTSSATGSQSISFGDESGTVCLSGSTNCGFLPLSTGSYVTDATTNNTIAINKTGATGNLISLQKNGGAVFTVSNTGALQIQNSSSAALDIRNSAGTSYFSVDTTTGAVRVGPAAADANGVLFVLDTKNTGGDPAGANGGLYYNSSLGKFRCFENGEWKDCIGTRQVRSFVDSVTNAVVDNNTTNYWNIGAENNNSYPNITPSAASKSITGSVVVQVNSSSTADRSVVFRIERSIGTLANCGSGTTVGTRPSTFTTNNGDIATSTIIFVDSPATTSQVFYRVCSDTATSSAVGVTVDTLRVTLEEASNSN